MSSGFLAEAATLSASSDACDADSLFALSDDDDEASNKRDCFLCNCVGFSMLVPKGVAVHL